MDGAALEQGFADYEVVVPPGGKPYVEQCVRRLVNRECKRWQSKVVVVGVVVVMVVGIGTFGRTPWSYIAPIKLLCLARKDEPPLFMRLMTYFNMIRLSQRLIPDGQGIHCM